MSFIHLRFPSSFKFSHLINERVRCIVKPSESATCLCYSWEILITLRKPHKYGKIIFPLFVCCNFLLTVMYSLIIQSSFVYSASLAIEPDFSTNWDDRNSIQAQKRHHRSLRRRMKLTKNVSLVAFRYSIKTSFTWLTLNFRSIEHAQWRGGSVLVCSTRLLIEFNFGWFVTKSWQLWDFNLSQKMYTAQSIFRNLCLIQISKI